MFWGLSMEPQKRYTQTVTESFHISQGAIDVSSVGNETGPTQIILEYANSEYILATLSKSAKIYQVPLDLNFQKGDHVSFRTAGTAIVHLSGYHVTDDDDDDLAQRLLGCNDDDTDEEVDDDEEHSISDDSTSVPSGKKRKKAAVSAGKEKKSKLDDDDSDDEGDTSLGSTLGASTLLELESDSDEDDDDEDEEEEEEDDDDDDDDDDDEDEDDDEEEEEDVEEEVAVVTKKGKNTSVNGITPSGKKNKLNLSKTETPKTPKLGKQLNQSKQEKTPKQDGKSPKQEKTPKQDGKTPKQEKTRKQEVIKTPKQDKKTPKTATPATPGQKKVLEGGIVAEDLKPGDGPTAKPGKMAAVYYSGRLKSNNKQFDSSTSGPGFKFRIGRGEVIKGWDVGVAGMRVGGKRRLTIPATLAYGARGSPPVIPPNATLVFDVELRSLS